MVRFYDKKQKGMVRAKSGKFYYPSKKNGKAKGRYAKPRMGIISRQPFPNITKRVLTYAFRDQIQPPQTSSGGFSCASIAYRINYPYDIDPAGATVTSSARRNHQPMGYDQLEVLYEKQRVDWVKLRVNFAMEKPAVTYTESSTDTGGGVITQGTQFSSVPLRVALLITKESSLPTSLLTVSQNTVSFEKLIEMSKSGLLPSGSALIYKTMHHDQIIQLSKGVNLFKFFKRHDNKTWSDWVEDNSRGFNGSPTNQLYCHIICSPISVTGGDNHQKVTFYGDMSLGMTFSDLKTFGQS